MDFNSVGLYSRLSGNTLQFSNKYRVTEILETGYIKFDIAEPSLVVAYIELPEGL